LKNLLTNPTPCGIINSVKGTQGADHNEVGGESSAVRSPKTFKKSLKNPLTISTRCGTIRMFPRGTEKTGEGKLHKPERKTL
jgi:hypothetical protein